MHDCWASENVSKPFEYYQASVLNIELMLYMNLLPIYHVYVEFLPCPKPKNIFETW